jgi:hypothetical protein
MSPRSEAQQRFFEALHTLVCENKTRYIRLTLAAQALARLPPMEQLPGELRDEIQQLRDSLMRPPPLTWPNGYVRPRKATPLEARRMAGKILDIYILLGGLT